MTQRSIHSPVGDITVSESDGAIVALDWGWGCQQTETRLLAVAIAWLYRYFDGDTATPNFPLTLTGTDYQLRVWNALRTIPPGETRSYTDIARQAGGSPRSVGGANARNPLPLIVPCHRVIGTAGLGGYSGGDGLATKTFLLNLESRATSQRSSQAAATEDR